MRHVNSRALALTLAGAGLATPAVAQFSYALVFERGGFDLSIGRFGDVLFQSTAVVDGRPVLVGGTPNALAFTPLSGAQAPGLPAGVTFGVLAEVGSANSAGRGAFRSHVAGSLGWGGLWTGRAGEMELLAAAGLPAPGMAPGVVFAAQMGQASVNDGGVHVFTAPMAGPGITPSNSTAIWVGQAGDLRTLVRAGDPVPGGVPGGIWAGFSDVGCPQINRDGTIVFTADLQSAFTGTSVWKGPSEDLRLLARIGDPAPGWPAGVVLSSVGWPTSFPVLGDDGQVACRCEVTGPGITVDTRHGILSDKSGSLESVARGGQHAPGLPPGVVFTALGHPVVSASGMIAFTAEFKGPGITGSNDSGLWAGTPDALHLVAREGDQAPGWPAGVAFDEFHDHSDRASLALGDSGVLAFVVQTRGQGGWEGGAWTATVGEQPTAVVRAGHDFDADPDPLVTDLKRVATVNLGAGPGTLYHRSMNGMAQCLISINFEGSLQEGVYRFRLTECPADLTTTANPAGAGYAVIDGVLNNEDFFFFLQQYAEGHLGVADVTTTATQGQPGYGVPDGRLSSDDFFYYLTLFAGGC